MKAYISGAKWLAGSCLATMATAAVAQDQGGAPPPAPVEESTAAATPDAKSDQLQDIVVTAQRRTESLQRVPITITALNASALAETGVSGSVDLGQVVPGLVFTKNIGSGAPYLRGVGPGPTGQPGYESRSPSTSTASTSPILRSPS